MLDYIVIPKHVFNELGGSKAFCVLCALIFNRNTSTNNSHFMSKPDIAKKSNISRRWVYNVIDTLIEKGFIVEVAERRNEYMYYLKCLEYQQEIDVKVDLDIEAMMEKVREI